MQELTGTSIIGFGRGLSRAESQQGFNPTTNEPIGPHYYSASIEEVDRAARLADQAFATYSRKSGREKGVFLRKIAENIESTGQPLVDRATAETGLPAARIQAETGRTCAQLRMFADLVEEGSWVDARIDKAQPDRKPLPKPDIRSILRPIGPVVVFCASNFPLAFSVAGGDTASAFAAGNPVIVKAHHAHPGTAEMIGLAVSSAVKSCEMPEGTFSLLYGSGSEIGTALVKHPMVKAGGFTGSRAGGRALMDACAARPEPIPFYAEMSSINPVFILPGAMKSRRDEIATGLHGSVTLGAGQFCTNPGLVLMNNDGDSSAFANKLGELMAASAAFTMLTPGISSAYDKGVGAKLKASNVKAIAQNKAEGKCQTGAALFQTDAQTFLENHELSDEVFGPSTLLVTYSGREQMLEIARKLEGHLTATIQGTEDDLREYSDLIAILEMKVGRLLFNGFPTGVEVCHSMVHGGPYPATSDGRSTSVGTRAIFRFTRQFCYQTFPDSALPAELQNANPLGILRMIDGKMTKESI